MNLKPFKSELSAFVTANLGRLQALAISRAYKIVNEQLQKLLNTCPPPEELEKIAKIVNAVRPIIANTERELAKARKAADVLEPVIQAADIIILILTYNPKPVAIGTISVNGVPTVVYSATEGKVNRSATKLGWFGAMVGVLRDEGKAIANVVQATEGVFQPIVNALDQIDALIQACMSNQDLSDEERKKLLDSIQRKTSDIEARGVQYRSIKSGRDYTIKIINDPNAPAIAPKRQAIVQDFRGITVLSGPSSFASDPQILIEEIKFRIENQLP